MCRPGTTVEEFLDGAPPGSDEIVERVVAHLRSVDAEIGGDLIVDPLDAKILFKHGPTFAILDRKTKWIAVGFSLRRRLESARLSRKVSDYGNKFFHVVNVTSVDQLDDELLAWLTEAYGHGVEPPGDAMSAASGDDPMVPDDIDFEIAPPR